MWVKPRKLKVSGLPSPLRSRRFAAWLDQASLLRVKRQRELLEPLAHRVPEAPGITLVRKANDDVVGIPHNHHSARGLVLASARPTDRTRSAGRRWRAAA